jgi:hypothetical protein
MKKPVRPPEPQIPEILKDLPVPGFSEPEEYLDHIIFQTKTRFETALEEFKKANPDPSEEEIVKYFQEKYDWSIEFSDDGTIDRIDGSGDDDPKDFPANAHNSSGSEPFSLSDILDQVDPSEYHNVRVKGVANYKGDYIWGDPGVCVYVRRKNPNYIEQIKAHVEYTTRRKEWWVQDRNYHDELKKYQQERERKISDKIKEMEDSGEI